MAEAVLFWILALVAVGSAVLMVANANPVRSALFLVGTFLSVAVFYIMLSAQFIAAVQVIVYAGAIMVLFLFVIMLLNLGAPDALRERGSTQRRIAIVLGILMLVMLVASRSLVDLLTPPMEPKVYQNQGTVESIGRNLFDPTQPWLFPFEATSILLLIAIIGAIIMAKRRIDPAPGSPR